MRVRVVALEGEVLIDEIEDRVDLRIEAHRGQRARRAAELQPRLFEVVQVEVRVAERVDEVAGSSPVTCATIMVSSA